LYSYCAYSFRYVIGRHEQLEPSIKFAIHIFVQCAIVCHISYTHQFIILRRCFSCRGYIKVETSCGNWPWTEKS